MAYVKKCKYDSKNVILFMLVVCIIVQWVLFMDSAKMPVYSLLTALQIALLVYVYYSSNLSKISKNKKITKWGRHKFILINGKVYSFNILENISVGILVTENGECTYANKTSVKIFHGKNSKEVIDANFIKNINMTDTINHQYKIIGIDGSRIAIETISIPQALNGQKNYITIIMDVTEKVAQEENKIFLYQAFNNEKEKLELFSNISHEFSTPLNLILNAAQLNELYIKNENYNEVLYNENLKVIKTNAYRLNRTITNIIDVIKIQNGYYDVHMENKDIIEFVENIVDKVVPLVKERGKTIVFDTDVEEKVIAFDAEKIERVMLNLITNAVKYTDTNGKIKVQIYDGQDEISISCIDNGIGIPKTKLSSLFKIFTQIDKSLKRKREGMGIGLSITKALVDAHKGEIEVKSIYGLGSEFILKLPAKVINQEGNKWDKVYRGLEVDVADIEFSDIPPKDIIREVYAKNN